ncbi:MAG: acetyl-CoA carboxylase biotin carboxyl carrier protein [Candidatus Omnitrophica bacterium]|nr:acetyl-CoA carboxylase biotin carboxyl carrier protein [Candidatus Omnitrophota bacterium]
MNLKELKEIINLMKEHGLTELEIEKDGFKIRLKKSNGQIIAHEEVYYQPKGAVAPQAAAPQAPAAPTQPVAAANEVLVRSPMVGTYYSAPAPDQSPYVNVGTTIKTDDVLCIVEAMKLMNEIKSEVSGKIVEMLVENGTPVEFDQPLFRVALS